MRSLGALVDIVQREGAAVLPDFTPEPLLAALQVESDRLSDGGYAHRFPKSTRVWDLYRHGQPFIELLTLPQLGYALTALLGEHYLLSDYSLNIVNPEQPVDDWHLDYPYNEMPQLVSGSLLGLQCVLTLSDFTSDNGATQYHPGSHNPVRRPPVSVESQPQTLVAPPGTLLMLAATTWHRSGLNRSAAPRTAILLSFVERWVRPMMDSPGPGPWSCTRSLRLLLGEERPPESINGVPIQPAKAGAR